MKRPASKTLSKALDISSATDRVAPDLLKALTILSDTTVTRSAVDRKNLKPYWKSEERHIFRGDQQSYYLFKDFTNFTKKTNRAVVFSGRPFPNILKYRDHQRNLRTIWKTKLFQTYIEEFS